MRCGRIFLVLMLMPILVARYVAAESIWDLQAVDADGMGTHPKVGADPGADPANSANRVTIEGIALNASAEMLNPAMMWQVYVQGEAPDQGGIAAWAGIFYNPTWPRYPADIEAGDRVRISGFVQNASGKINITERHSAAPGMQFTVEKLASNVGMPEPIVIPSLAGAVGFDATRATGGERYQAQWVRVNGLQIHSGTWAPGSSLVVGDSSGSTITLLLSARGDFDQAPAPAAPFSVEAIFDQEDGTPPYTGDYRLWVKRRSDIEAAASAASWELYD